jgi:ArsR family transcriptional regulator, arsenate/arsenite/antimonite-responsive transcriptional repressor
MKAVMSSQIENNQKEVEFNLHQMIKSFKALSEPTRVRILLLLLHRECCVCEVSQALDISQTRTSRSLKALYEAGFLKLRKMGLWSQYSIDKEVLPPPLRKIIEAIGKAMEGNPVIARDRQQLATVQVKRC